MSNFAIMCIVMIYAALTLDKKMHENEGNTEQ